MINLMLTRSSRVCVCLCFRGHFASGKGWTTRRCTSCTHPLPLLRLRCRNGSSSWVPKRPWSRCDRETNYNHSLQASVHELSVSDHLNGWTTPKCLVQMSNLRLLVRYPIHICRLGPTREDRRLVPREELPWCGLTVLSDRGYRYLVKVHRGGRRCYSLPLQSEAGSRRRK